MATYQAPGTTKPRNKRGPPKTATSSISSPSRPSPFSVHENWRAHVPGAGASLFAWFRLGISIILPGFHLHGHFYLAFLYLAIGAYQVYTWYLVLCRVKKVCIYNINRNNRKQAKTPHVRGLWLPSTQALGPTSVQVSLLPTPGLSFGHQNINIGIAKSQLRCQISLSHVCHNCCYWTAAHIYRVSQGVARRERGREGIPRLRSKGNDRREETNRRLLRGRWGRQDLHAEPWRYANIFTGVVPPTEQIATFRFPIIHVR